MKRRQYITAVDSPPHAAYLSLGCGVGCGPMAAKGSEQALFPSSLVAYQTRLRGVLENIC